MKKLLAIVLSLCMVFSAFGMLAAAEEATEAATEETTEVTVLDWTSIEESVTAENGFEGDFVTLDEVAIKIWVPTAMEAVELTDEDKEEGCIGYYETEDGAYALAVTYVDADGISLEELAEQLSEAGATSISFANVNGIGMVGYNDEESDTTYIAAVTEAGYVLEFAFYPLSDESFSATMGVMVCSIQAVETEE